MPDTWILDARHFEGADTAPDAPPQTARMARYVARLVHAATAVRQAGTPYACAVPCRRRPDRKPCVGPLIVTRLDVPARIDWTCAACGDGGTITGWRGGPWDLGPDAALVHADPRVRVHVEPSALLDLVDSAVADAVLQAALWSATYEPDGLVLDIHRDILGDLTDACAAEANHATGPTRRRLDALYAQLAAYARG